MLVIHKLFEHADIWCNILCFFIANNILPTAQSFGVAKKSFERAPKRCHDSGGFRKGSGNIRECGHGRVDPRHRLQECGPTMSHFQFLEEPWGTLFSPCSLVRGLQEMGSSWVPLLFVSSVALTDCLPCRQYPVVSTHCVLVSMAQNSGLSSSCDTIRWQRDVSSANTARERKISFKKRIP